MALDIPVFSGKYSGFTVKGKVDTDITGSPVLDVSISYDGIPVFAVKVRGSQVAGELKTVANLLAPIALELGEDFAAWWKDAFARLFPHTTAPVLKIGGRAIPARFANKVPAEVLTVAPNPDTVPDVIVPPAPPEPITEGKPMPPGSLNPDDVAAKAESVDPLWTPPLPPLPGDSSAKSETKSDTEKPKGKGKK